MPIHLPFLTLWLPHPLCALLLLLEIPSSFLPAIALGELTGLGMGGSVWLASVLGALYRKGNFRFTSDLLLLVLTTFLLSFHRIVNAYNDGIVLTSVKRTRVWSSWQRSVTLKAVLETAV